MSLERLVEEIRQRAEAEIAGERERRDTEAAKLRAEGSRRVEAIRSESRKQGELEIARERAQRLARAKLDARKRVFEARERRMGRLLGSTRDVLSDVTSSAEYGPLLKRLYSYAVQSLGKQVKVRGRAEDAALLKTIAKSGFVADPVAILGGLLAETADGSRRLNLSFDELLRLREDQVRDLLAA
ncbi:MAG TPA: V-type ATP synthase subunit E family protein [Thermoplasmata archaeon]|nr:V-type ATP synthase subunit E family protein [Thermoplasmata archaeon]